MSNGNSPCLPFKAGGHLHAYLDYTQTQNDIEDTALTDECLK